MFPPAQCGFPKNHRTTNHIFTLMILIKKYIKNGKYLYICFVDFQKLYSRVPNKRPPAPIIFQEFFQPPALIRTPRLLSFLLCESNS